MYYYKASIDAGSRNVNTLDYYTVCTLVEIVLCVFEV